MVDTIVGAVSRRVRKLGGPIYPRCTRCGGHELARMRIETHDDIGGGFHMKIYWRCTPCQNDKDYEVSCEVLEIIDDPDDKILVIGWTDDDDGTTDGRMLV